MAKNESLIQVSQKLRQPVVAVQAVVEKLGIHLGSGGSIPQEDAEAVSQVFAVAADRKVPAIQVAEEYLSKMNSNTVETVGDEFSAISVQRRNALMSQMVDDAKQRAVLGKVAEDLAIAQLTATDWDLRDHPDLEAMLAQSTAIRQRVEAVNPVTLPFSQMMAIAFEGVPILEGKLPALPGMATLTLPCGQPTNQPTTNQPTNQPPTN